HVPTAGSAEQSRTRQQKSTKRTGSAAWVFAISSLGTDPLRDSTENRVSTKGHLTQAGCSAHGFLTPCGPCRSPCPNARVTPRVGLPHPSPMQRLAPSPLPDGRAHYGVCGECGDKIF